MLTSIVVYSTSTSAGSSETAVSSTTASTTAGSSVVSMGVSSTASSIAVSSKNSLGFFSFYCFSSTAFSRSWFQSLSIRRFLQRLGPQRFFDRFDDDLRLVLRRQIEDAATDFLTDSSVSLAISTDFSRGCFVSCLLVGFFSS